MENYSLKEKKDISTKLPHNNFVLNKNLLKSYNLKIRMGQDCSYDFG